MRSRDDWAAAALDNEWQSRNKCRRAWKKTVNIFSARRALECYCSYRWSRHILWSKEAQWHQEEQSCIRYVTSWLISSTFTENKRQKVLLRAVEYYRGILFLTTNRLGVVDEAFMSRVHVPLYFKDLSADDRRKIWTNNFQRLRREASGKMEVTEAAEDYATSKDVINLKWNGRDIRNGQ